MSPAGPAAFRESWNWKEWIKPLNVVRSQGSWEADHGQSLPESLWVTLVIDLSTTIDAALRSCGPRHGGSQRMHPQTSEGLPPQ